MKVAILAGGRGTRLVDETAVRPKPMVEVGARPILWHVMRHYAHHGFTSFVVALGYLGEAIERYFAENTDDWSVECVDTGSDTKTGGRIKRLAPHLDADTFMLTWSDGLSDIDLAALLAFHRSHGRLATVTAVHPPPRFGRLTFGEGDDRVIGFAEKEVDGSAWINGAFFVLEPGVMDYIDGDATSWERETLPRLAADGQLMGFRHRGFWQCMDTPYDRLVLQELWDRGAPPWKVWD